MSDTLERLAENYALALGHYLSGGGEAPLEQAYELGRQAIEDHLGVLDLTSIHQQALEAIALRALTPEENQRIAKQTMSFLTEALSPFEMTQRGYQETLARLHRLNETLEQEVAERTAALTAEVAEHQRAEEAVRQSEEHFRLIVDTALDAVITIDSQGAITGWNAQAEAIFGWSAQDILGQTLIATIIPPRYREAHQHGLKHFLARGEGPVLNKRIEITALHRDGDEFPVELAITPVKSGEAFTFSAFVRDITARQRAEEQIRQSAARAQALAELSGALTAAHLDYQAVLDAIAQRTVELIGDAGAIRLVSDDEQWLEVVSLYHSDAETLAFMREILTALPQPVSEGLGGQVMKTHQPMLIPVVSSEQMRAMVPRTAWPVLERVNIHSLLVVPLRAQGRMLGTLALTRDRPGHSYTADDQSFLQDLADRAALAISNARLFQGIQNLNAELEQRVADRTAQLQESEEKFSKAFLASPAAVSIASLPDGRYINVNEAMAKLTGYSSEELIAHTSVELGLVDATARTKILESVRKSGFARNVEIQVHTKSNQIVDVLASIEQIELNGRPCVLSVNYDITERKRAEAEVQRLNTDLEQQASQLQATNRELQHAQAEAVRANQAKSEFLSRMSHELRTPLNAILGFAQVMSMEAIPQQEEGIKHILAGGRHLLDLINEVLDIARIETGRLSLSPEPVLVSEVVQETLDLIEPLAAQRNIQLHLAHIGNQHIQADHQRFKQVLLNLLSNAVKYNREGGQVTVTCVAAPTAQPGERLRLEVTDTGPGIPADKVGRLFTPFDRLDADETVAPGTGLGLALSKSLVEAMGGAMGVASVIGQGSTFWVELPIAEAPKERLQRTGHLMTYETRPLAKAKTVLYAEDNLSNLRLIEQILAFRPTLRLMTAMQGQICLDLAREHRPNLILLDLNLPDMHGSQVLSLLQAEPQTRAIPVVVISADATPHQIERLLAAGARAYLTKPLEVKPFLQLVDELLA